MPSGCLFCVKADEPDEEAHILHRGDRCYVLLNRFPYNNGHLMVAPYEHVASLEDLDFKTLAELMALVKRGLGVLRGAYQPEGFNVGANIGAAAGAGVEDHLHVHIVPRWAGDTNYMTTVGKTRTIPEWIEETYNQLRPLFDQRDEH